MLVRAVNIVSLGQLRVGVFQVTSDFKTSNSFDGHRDPTGSNEKKKFDRVMRVLHVLRLTLIAGVTLHRALILSYKVTG